MDTMCVYPNGIGATLRTWSGVPGGGSNPLTHTIYWTGEMVNTGASNTPAEMHEGSTPSSSTPL